MSRQLDDLLQAMAADLGRVGPKIDALGTALTPELADKARDAYQRAMNGRQLNTAFLASMLASVLYGKLGRWRESLNSHIDWLQIRFMAAQTVEQYASVHETACDAIKKAADIKARDLALQAQVLAADSAYFASEAAGADTKQKEKWLAAALEDVLAALSADPAGATVGVLGEKLLGVLCSAAVDIESGGLGRNPKLAELLKKAGAKSQASVPADYAVQGNAKKTQWIRQTLARLAAKHG